ncbi:aminopeptidase P family protein [Clostridium sp. CM028]|uniref:M24 family metallopeptidase n=1 Tax=unclassified Clostridium TaxID=2614128 RepID=UPI001C0E28A8|nr:MULTISPECIES: aminopeptidase P family protein [unclassified Clostridium]MBU3092439.1 aminopeptidase P family protein [Clostridium sp. CF011]MBW9146907.1 aminopeptidase P family protein [Clostridium sp. CM027]MBW9148069.1 aminopeptidase P family protein [Clostridium sp. CM028]UVE40827.1 aminopeptidase P family protein [Clostridium sp. CM027]WAG69808.1 aminopeptidase P family protein [Clostridium sp. CF011]
MLQERLNKVLKIMALKKTPQMIVSDPAAIFYLTGKWILSGERMLVLYINLDGHNKLFINELFPISEDLGVEKIWFNDTQSPVEIIARNIDKDKPMGIDKNWPAHFLIKLMKLKGGSTFVNGSEILDRVRMCKDEGEKDLMRAASKLNDTAVDKMIKLIPKKYSEKKMGKLLGDIWEEMGTEGHSFDPIIGYGANAADPHHELDGSMVKEGDSVVIDIGCKMNSYCSDMTRTVFYKSVSDHSREVYNIVKEANKRGIEKVKAGVRFCDIDAAARDYISEKGYGKYFTHRLGHSIGIEVHDFGDVSSANTDKVQPGQIFSIEPGIYLPGDVGVRIEDLVIVTKEGCEVLNHYTKDLIIVE